MSVISILSSRMEKWHNGSVLAHYCCLRLASLLCLCVFFLHRGSKDFTAAIVETSILCLTAGLPKTLGKHRKHKTPKYIPTVFGGLPWQHIVDLLESRGVCWVDAYWDMPKQCPPVQGRAAIAYALSVTPPKWEDSHCRDTEFVKDRNSLLAFTACLILKECLDKNLN